jgi:hypothetical protein
MMAKDKAKKRERAVVSAQAMVDLAPVAGSKATYLALPKNVKLFAAERGKTYRLIFIPWIAGKGNVVGKPGTYVTNRYLHVHKMVGPNDEAHICPQKTWGKPCAVCRKFQQLRPTTKGNKTAWDGIKDMQPKDREVFLIHDLDGEKNNLQFWEESCYLFGNFLRQKISRKESYRLFADFTKGKVVEVLGVEKKMGNGSCTEFSSIEFEDRTDTKGNPLDLEHIFDLAEKICVDDCVRETPNEQLKKLMGENVDEDGLVEGDDDEPDQEDEDEEPEDPSDTEDEEEEEVEGAGDEDDEDEDKPPVKKGGKKGDKPKPGTKPKPKPEPEEEEEEEEDDEDEEEDEEEEPEEEEEEEPEPPKKPSGKKGGKK